MPEESRWLKSRAEVDWRMIVLLVILIVLQMLEIGSVNK